MLSSHQIKNICRCSSCQVLCTLNSQWFLRPQSFTILWNKRYEGNDICIIWAGWCWQFFSLKAAVGSTVETLLESWSKSLIKTNLTWSFLQGSVMVPIFYSQISAWMLSKEGLRNNIWKKKGLSLRGVKFFFERSLYHHKNRMHNSRHYISYLSHHSFYYKNELMIPNVKLVSMIYKAQRNPSECSHLANDLLHFFFSSQKSWRQTVGVVTTIGTAVLCSLHIWPYLSAAPVSDGKRMWSRMFICETLAPHHWELGMKQTPSSTEIFPVFLPTDPSFFPCSSTSTWQNLS